MNRVDPENTLNPYAAPQAKLAALASPPGAHGRPRLQASYLRNAMRNTLYVNLVLIGVALGIGILVGMFEREWNATLQAIWAGASVITVFCWPIVIAVGVGGTFWDYFLQLIGRRTYDTPPSQANFVVAEFADTTAYQNPYAKH